MTRFHLARHVVALGFLAAWDGTARRTCADEPQKPTALEAKGYVVALHQPAVGPVSGGRVTELLVQEGQVVKKGEVLARLDDTLARLEVHRTEARLMAAKARLVLLKAGPPKEAVAAAQADVDQAEAQVKTVEAQVKRVVDLAAKGAVDRATVDEKLAEVPAARARLERAKSGLDSLMKGRRPEETAVAEAEVHEAEAVAAKARYLLEDMTVRAPFDGTVLILKATAGTYVNPLAFGAPGYICEMANLRQLEVEVDVQERDVGRVLKGQRCIISPEAFPKRRYQGEVSRLMPVANRAKGAMTLRVRVEIPDQDDVLRPDMGAIVTFLKKE